MRIIEEMKQLEDDFYYSSCLQLMCDDDDRSCADVIRISPSRDQENDSHCTTLCVKSRKINDIR